MDNCDKPTIDPELFKLYVEMAKKENKTVDINLIEYAVGSYLYYEHNKIERPLNESKEFEKINNQMIKLIEESKKINV